jgi:hypothetical protein
MAIPDAHEKYDIRNLRDEPPHYPGNNAPWPADESAPVGGTIVSG